MWRHSDVTRLLRFPVWREQSIFWLLTSLWRHLKSHQHQTYTQPSRGIQVGVCKVSRFYAYALRRYCVRSKGGATLCPPQRLAGGADPSACRVKEHQIIILLGFLNQTQPIPISEMFSYHEPVNTRAVKHIKIPFAPTNYKMFSLSVYAQKYGTP